MVLKPALCDGARHIALVHDLDEARAIEREWREDERRGGERRGAALLQQWVQEPAVVRLFATPDRVSLAYEKSREEGEVVTHGTVYPRVYEAPPPMADLARRMVATLGGGLMGVDVLVDCEGRHFALEANAPFGFDVTDPEQGRFVACCALERARRAVPDWAGGTRIGQALADFNDEYACLGLARGAVAIIVSDGWDRGDPELLERELERLRRQCRRLVWLNPRPGELADQPLATGMRAALRHVDDFVPGHDPRAAGDFARLLAGLGPGRPRRRQPVGGGALEAR